MKPWMHIALGIVTAAAIIITAWLTKGTEHENAWLWIIGIYAVISGGLELYFSRNRDD